MSLVDQLRRSDRPAEFSAVLTELLQDPVKEAVAEALEENPELVTEAIEESHEVRHAAEEAVESDDSTGFLGWTSALVGGYVFLGMAVVSALALRSWRSSDEAPFEDRSSRVGEPATSRGADEGEAAPFSAPSADREETDRSDEGMGTTDDDTEGFGGSSEESDYESTDDEIGTQSSSSSSS